MYMLRFAGATLGGYYFHGVMIIDRGYVYRPRCSLTSCRSFFMSTFCPRENCILEGSRVSTCPRTAKSATRCAWEMPTVDVRRRDEATRDTARNGVLWQHLSGRGVFLSSWVLARARIMKVGQHCCISTLMSCCATRRSSACL